MATIIYLIAAIVISVWVADLFNSGIFGIICFGFFLPGFKLPLIIDAIFLSRRK